MKNSMCELERLQVELKSYKYQGEKHLYYCDFLILWEEESLGVVKKKPYPDEEEQVAQH